MRCVLGGCVRRWASRPRWPACWSARRWCRRRRRAIHRPPAPRPAARRRRPPTAYRARSRPGSAAPSAGRSLDLDDAGRLGGRARGDLREVRPRRRPRAGARPPAADRLQRHRVSAWTTPGARRSPPRRRCWTPCSPTRRSPAVNGDFFDIGDTGAPLGVGRDRQRKMLHGVASGWNCAFFIKRDGQPDIDFLYATGRIVQHPEIEIPTVNAPSVRQGGIGLYTDKWGELKGYRVTDGQKQKVRMVVVQDGVVTENRKTLPQVAPGAGQDPDRPRRGRPTSCAQLKKGTPITVKSRLRPAAQGGDHRQRLPDPRRRAQGPRRPRDAPADRGRHRLRHRRRSSCWSSTAGRTSAGATRWSRWPS